MVTILSSGVLGVRDTITPPSSAYRWTTYSIQRISALLGTHAATAPLLNVHYRIIDPPRCPNLPQLQNAKCGFQVRRENVAEQETRKDTALAMAELG